MNIKSLLIGSAAALATVSGAYAADAVVAAEPEPMEYVRVCDAYGAGFFYIPGTETCLAISGYVWYQVTAESWVNGGDTYAIHMGNANALNNGWHKWVRARVNFDARTETEYGTLRSYIRLQGDWFDGAPSTDAAVALDQAYIQLGGLDLGYSESFYVDDHISGAMNYGSYSWYLLSYGYQQRARIGYRFKGGNGFFGVVGLEQDDAGNYVPDVVGKVGVEQSWGWLALAAAWDESDSSVAVKAGVQVNIPNMPGSAFKVIGQYTNSATNAYGAQYDAGLIPFATQAANWSILAAYNQQFNEKFGASIGVQYFDGFAGFPNGYQVELSGVYMATPNLELRGEVGYAKTSGFDGTLSGYLRVTRYF